LEAQDFVGTIDDTVENIGVMDLLDGQYACAPEDGHGNYNYSLALCSKDLGDPKSVEALQDAKRASRYTDYPTYRNFNSKAFDLKKTKIIFNEVLKTPPSKNDSSNMFHLNFLTGMRSGGETLGIEKLLTPTKECVVCGKTEDLKKCAKCLVVFYCSKEHQTQDWKRHKLECQKDINAI